MSVIQVDRLTKDFGMGRGVFDVSLTVEQGEVYGFLGPNGAGKTTTIRHIMGFVRPQHGAVKVSGLDSWRHAHRIQRDLGYLPGEIALPESMTGTEFIRMMAKLRGLDDWTHTRSLIEKFQLDPAGSMKRMSMGMKRKLAIVTAFMHNPSVLVLDEPTSGLDPLMQNVFIRFIEEEKAKGKTILLSSHLFHEVEAVCDRVSFIKDGRIISAFEMADVRQHRNKTFELEFPSREAFDRFRREADSAAQHGIHLLSPDERECRVQVRFDRERLNAFIAWIGRHELQSLTEVPFSLEQAFLKYYDRHAEAAGRDAEIGSGAAQ